MAAADNANKYKWVKILSPGGVVINYQGQTGFTNKPVVLSTDLIKEFIDQKALVIELGEESETILTEDNFDSDNGGLEVTEEDQIVENIEIIHSTAREEKQEARISKIGQEFKKYFEENASRNITALSIDVTEDDLPLTGYLGNAKIPGTTTATLDDGSEVELKLDWDTSEVDLVRGGEFNIIGTPILTKYISNTDNLTVTFKLTVGIDISGGDLVIPDDDDINW